MILHCNYEELQALASSGAAIVAAAEAASHGSVSAPAERVARVETLLPRLTGDLTIETLPDQRRVRDAVALICEDVHGRLDETIIAYGPAHEDAVTMYFDYGHSRSVLARLDRMGAEMEAIIDLISGGSAGAAAGISFPD
ncbi:MAG TPA: hypothetical protein VNP72_05360 [Longimicrobium sp.]|nr:hypothetical protein [Longimicrobium sp.]